jgi:hypothetical protein
VTVLTCGQQADRSPEILVAPGPAQDGLRRDRVREPVASIIAINFMAHIDVRLPNWLCMSSDNETLIYSEFQQKLGNKCLLWCFLVPLSEDVIEKLVRNIRIATKLASESLFRNSLRPSSPATESRAKPSKPSRASMHQSCVC